MELSSRVRQHTVGASSTAAETVENRVRAREYSPSYSLILMAYSVYYYEFTLMILTAGVIGRDWNKSRGNNTYLGFRLITSSLRLGLGC